MAQDKKIELHFIVNGNTVREKVKVEDALVSVLGHVLKKAGVAGDPQPDRWDFSYNGKVLDANQTVEQLGLPDGAQIFLNLKAGVAG